MIKRNVRILSAASIATLGTVVACSSSSSGTQGGSTSGQATLAPSAYAVTGSSAADVDVEATYLAFPAATHSDQLERGIGDILIGEQGGVGTKNPLGFLRKVTALPVTSTDGTTITIKTTGATLQEAFSQAKFQATLQTPQLGLTGPATAQATVVHPRPQGVGTSGTCSPDHLLDFSGTNLFSSTNSVTLHSGDTVGYTASVTIKTGTLTFTPSWDIAADIEPNLSDPLSSVQSFHASATGELDADLELTAAFNLTGNMTGEDLADLIAQQITASPSSTLADYNVSLGTISVGILSIPVNAEFKATLACDLSYGGGIGVDVGANATGSITAGFDYQNSTLTPVYANSESFTMIGPNWTADSAVHVRCSVKPEFDLSFFDVASGSVYAEPHVSLDASATCSASQLTGNVSGSAQAGIDAVASANVDIFGLYQWNKTCTLFDVESPTASFSGTFPLPGGSTTTCASNPPPANPAEAAPPPYCFGGGTPTGGGSSSGSTSSSSGSSSGGSSSGSTVADGGTSSTDSGAGNEDAGNCDHSACTTGDALGPTCTDDNQGGACIAAICKNDSFCCQFTWDGTCTAHVTNGDYGCLPADCQ